MLLQTNSYIVPKEKRAEHSRLMRRFRQALGKLGCDMFEIYEQVGANWSGTDSNGRYVQIMRFRDRKHQMAVQNAERTDPAAQALIAEFCELVNFPYQQQQGFFAVGFYNSVLPSTVGRVDYEPEETQEEVPSEIAVEVDHTDTLVGTESESGESSEPTHDMIDGELTSFADLPAGDGESESPLVVSTATEVCEEPEELTEASVPPHETPLLGSEATDQESLDLSEYQAEEIQEAEFSDSDRPVEPVKELKFEELRDDLELPQPEVTAESEELQSLEPFETLNPELPELSEEELLHEMDAGPATPAPSNGAAVYGDANADTDYGIEHVEDTGESAEPPE